MNKDHNAIAAPLAAARISELTQLSDEAFLDYARRLAGTTLPTPPVTSAAVPDTYEPAAAYLECVLDEHRCLLPLAGLAEIMLPPRSYTFLPNMPPWMLGLTAWRGEPVAVIDLEGYLTGGTHAENAPKQMGYSGKPAHGGTLLLTRHETLTCALLVRETGTIVAIPPAMLTTPAPNTMQWLISSRVQSNAGIYNDTIVLDAVALLAAIAQEIETVNAHG